MRYTFVPFVALAALLAISTGCSGGGGDDDDGDELIPGTLSILAGPAAPAAFAFGGSVPADGFWKVSPDSGRVSLISIGFQEQPGGGGPGHTATLTDCTPQYDRTDGSLTALLECPFDVAPGTYRGFGVNMTNSFEVLINDSANGLVTDADAPTLFGTGPAEYVTLDLTSSQPTVGFNYALPQALVVDSQTSVSITLVVDMIHSIEVEVAAGTPSFRDDLVYTPVSVFASPNGVADAAYYTQLGSTESYNYSAGPTNNDTLRIYYAGVDQPAATIVSPGIFGTSETGYAYATDPTGGTGSRAGGWLGQDSNGTICWAAATNFEWTAYTAIYQIDPVAVLGSSTTLFRDATTSPPPPASGETYASGCPAITPDNQSDLMLTAN